LILPSQVTEHIHHNLSRFCAVGLTTKLVDPNNEVSRVDLRRNNNIPRHHASQYKQKDCVTPHNPLDVSFVIRCGEIFNIIIL